MLRKMAAPVVKVFFLIVSDQGDSITHNSNHPYWTKFNPVAESPVTEFNRDLLIQCEQWKYQNNVWNLFIESNKNTKLRHWRRSGAFIVNFELISQVILVFSWLTLYK